MDDKQKQNYLDCGGVFCPFCGSGDIEASESVNVDGGVGTQGVSCNICMEDWTDVYKLFDVQLVKHDPHCTCNTCIAELDGQDMRG